MTNIWSYREKLRKCAQALPLEDHATIGWIDDRMLVAPHEHLLPKLISDAVRVWDAEKEVVDAA